MLHTQPSGEPTETDYEEANETLEQIAGEGDAIGTHF
jgi:hypothetical protein